MNNTSIRLIKFDLLIKSEFMTSSLNANYHQIILLLTCKLTATKINTPQQVLLYFVKRVIGANRETPVY